MPYIRLGDNRLWAHSVGVGEDVLLIAGLADDSSSWEARVDCLAHRFRVTTFDNRGVGRSSTPEGALWSVGDFARDALAVLDGLQIGRAHVIGSSLGAAAAQELAVAEPGRVRSLILNGSWVRGGSRFRALIESWIATAHRAGTRRELLDAISLWVYPPRLHADGTVARWLDPLAPVSGDAYEQARAGFLPAARALLGYDAADRPGQIQAPTLLTVGSEDQVLPAEHTRALAELIPDATVTVFEGCGHQPFQEQPERFNELAAEFLAAAGRRVRAVTA
jgi:pimeloyl-ACP methyl ester carboxylesterase